MATTKVWKVVRVLSDGRLVSAMVCHSRRFGRAYRTADGAAQIVSDCLAFTTVEDARDFKSSASVAGFATFEVWEAEAETAEPCGWLGCYLETASMARWTKRKDRGQGEVPSGYYPAPHGTLYCTNLRLFRRATP